MGHESVAVKLDVSWESGTVLLKMFSLMEIGREKEVKESGI